MSIDRQLQKLHHSLPDPAELLTAKSTDLPLDIPRDPQKFYDDFGHFTHYKRDKNNHPLKVEKLTSYQKEFWSHAGNVLEIKSNKIGQTTSALLEDFQRAILPENAGGEIIIGAQDQDFANQHVMDLKLMIKQSKKYHNYLIERPDKELLREMQSKVSMAVIRNPYGGRPTFIIGVGQNPSRTFSWKRIVHVHLSDISLIARKDWSEYWRGIYSRTIQTGAFIKIEAVPKGQQGLIHHLYERIKKNESVTDDDDDEPESKKLSFHLMEVNCQKAIKEGAMPQHTIDKAKRDMSKMEFESTFNCKFNPPGNQWYQDTWFKTDNYRI